MAKTLTAQNISSISSIEFQVESGVVTGLAIGAEVNYGELGLLQRLELWPSLTLAQRTAAQMFYNNLLGKAQAHFLAT